MCIQMISFMLSQNGASAAHKKDAWEFCTPLFSSCVGLDTEWVECHNIRRHAFLLAFLSLSSGAHSARGTRMSVLCDMCACLLPCKGKFTGFQRKCLSNFIEVKWTCNKLHRFKLYNLKSFDMWIHL